MEEKLQELKARLAEAADLGSVGSVLNWDQTTYMPVGGAEARGRQSAIIARLAHERATDPAIGKLLDELAPHTESLPYDSDDASYVRVARRDYDRMVKVPSQFIAEMSAHQTASYMTWAAARPANDFAKVQPNLEKTIDFSRRLAGYFPGYKHIADPLIGFADYGMKASDIRALFSQLREQLVPIVKVITSQPPAEDYCLHKVFPEAIQLSFSEEVVKQLGYDFKRGRLDKTHHPFTTKFSIGDVRITTRVNENDLGDCLFSTIHEAGHAMYEQGINPAYEATPLGGGTSSGVHESQSRLWENIVGRSYGFWQYFYPRLQEVFPSMQGDSLNDFYTAINKVQRSLIRTEADEVTYNLHIMVRFDLELAMLEGKLDVKDLPEVWRGRYTQDLGITPPDDRNGVMQDVHWFGGLVGGSFQGYTLGNILGAQFYEAALRAHPEIPAEIEKGNFAPLLGWLRENIYQYGSKFTASEIVQRATGSPITIEPYIRYLKTKYGQLYKL